VALVAWWAGRQFTRWEQLLQEGDGHPPRNQRR